MDLWLQFRFWRRSQRLLHSSRRKLQVKSFSVGPDQALSYPSNPATTGYITFLPDEHTTILPPATSGGPYTFFVAGNLSGGNWGAVVLQTTDLKTFDFVLATTMKC